MNHRLDAVVREAEAEGLLPEAVENLLTAALESFATLTRIERAFVAKSVIASSLRGVELFIALYLEGASRSAVTDTVAWSIARLAKLKKGRISLLPAKEGRSPRTQQRHKKAQAETSRLCGNFAEAAFGVSSDEPSLVVDSRRTNKLSSTTSLATSFAPNRTQVMMLESLVENNAWGAALGTMLEETELGKKLFSVCASRRVARDIGPRVHIFNMLKRHGEISVRSTS